MDMSDEMIRAVYQKDRAALEELLRSEDINAIDGDGRTALMHSVLAEAADPEWIRYLVSRGAAVDAIDKGQHWTALAFAARDQNEEVVRVLLESGVAVDPVDTFGNTPLSRCVMNTKPNLGAVRLLLQHGANPRAENRHRASPIDTVQTMGNQVGNQELIELLMEAATDS